MRARKTDPETSHIAGEANPLLKERDQRTVLLMHAKFPDGLTDFELAELMGGRQQTSVGKRRLELERDGLIEDSGFRRPAPSGSPANVYRITPAGQRKAMLMLTTGIDWDPIND